jgi:hypothetical protein
MNHLFPESKPHHDKYCWCIEQEVTVKDIEDFIRAEANKAARGAHMSPDDPRIEEAVQFVLNDPRIQTDEEARRGFMRGYSDAQEAERKRKED